MYTRSELRDVLTGALQDNGVQDFEAEEIADAVVERLDEEGAFEVDDVDDDE